MQGRIFLLALAVLITASCGGARDGQDDYVERMAEEHEGDEPIPSPAAEAEPGAPIKSERVVYGQAGGQEVTGYLARPAGGVEGAPGILVIHEWWGLNENIESMARQLAAEGYVALAVDLYGGEVAGDRDRARELAMAASEDIAAGEENLRQAHAFLVDEHGASRTGAIGWCFGGGWSLRAALLMPGELDAAVIYYGRLITEREQLAKLETPILGIFGSEDQGIPVDSVHAFESALEELGKAASVHVYEGADHAFANPSGTRYDAEAAEDAWRKTLAFFGETLLGDDRPAS